MARRDPIGIRLLTRNGYDWSPRYPAIVEAVNHLKVRSCLLDGEAVACNDQGLAVFGRLRYRRADASVFLYATCSSSTAKTYAGSRSKRARRRWRACCAAAGQGCA
jgi:ATP-dependent DNA ligase